MAGDLVHVFMWICEVPDISSCLYRWKKTRPIVSELGGHRRHAVPRITIPAFWRMGGSTVRRSSAQRREAWPVVRHRPFGFLPAILVPPAEGAWHEEEFSYARRSEFRTIFVVKWYTFCHNARTKRDDGTVIFPDSNTYVIAFPSYSHDFEQMPVKWSREAGHNEIVCQGLGGIRGKMWRKTGLLESTAHARSAPSLARSMILPAFYRGSPKPDDHI